MGEDRQDLVDIYIDRFTTLVISAFGLVAALAWNDAIKALINEVFDKPDAVRPMFVYATVITVVAVIATYWISKIAEKAKKIT
ncbi:MAG: hypothetical protein GXO65_03940 [Euryarchaeota archaeon]|nr:hypothetical protein [Euryarchaeota archaeon]